MYILDVNTCNSPSLFDFVSLTLVKTCSISATCVEKYIRDHTSKCHVLSTDVNVKMTRSAIWRYYLTAILSPNIGVVIEPSAPRRPRLGATWQLARRMHSSRAAPHFIHKGKVQTCTPPP